MSNTTPQQRIDILRNRAGLITQILNCRASVTISTGKLSIRLQPGSTHYNQLMALLSDFGADYISEKLMLQFNGETVSQERV
jgi:hypothetical protein